MVVGQQKGLVAYLKVTIISRYIFLRFWLKIPFASATFCIIIANDCGYKILRFGANPQKYQTLVPAKNSHLKVHVSEKRKSDHLHLYPLHCMRGLLWYLKLHTNLSLPVVYRTL